MEAEHIASAAGPEQFPAESVPEIAFLGRSNVGKSSLLNTLVGMRDLAFTSSRPGCTQLINFFRVAPDFGRVRKSWFFVDLPGYGYARAPKALKAEWSRAAEEYLAKRERLVLSIHIVDSRHEPSNQDLQLHEWLVHHHKPHLIVATKSDKLSNNELHRNTDRISRSFRTDQVLIYSATRKRGREELWGAIEKSLKS